jgi:hypothetical protein
MWPADEVINIIPARKRRTSANDIDTFLHGKKMWLYYWNPDIKSKVIWNTEIVIVWIILSGHMQFMFMQKRTKNGLDDLLLPYSDLMQYVNVLTVVLGEDWSCLGYHAMSIISKPEWQSVMHHFAPVITLCLALCIYLHILNAEWWKQLLLLWVSKGDTPHP